MTLGPTAEQAIGRSMGLTDSPDEAAFRGSLRTWLGEHAADAPTIHGEPTAEQVEQWRTWSRRLYEAGYAGITWPAAYGGAGRPATHQAIWLEETGRAGVPDHLGVIGVNMAGPTIIEWGTDEQKKRFLAPLLRCDEIWCQGFSEPESGSDLASVRATAVLDGDAWVLNGQKVWSSYAHIADWCIVLARTDRSAAKHLGLSFFLVDMRLPGVQVVPLAQLTGDPEFNEIFFDDVRIPASSILGKPGDGWRVAMTTLSHERGTYGVGLAARLDSQLRAALSLIDDIDATETLGDALPGDELTELWIDLQALRITNLRALSVLTESGVPGPESTIAKLHWSELNQRLARLMVETLGPAGLELGEGAVAGGRWPFAQLRARGNTIEAGTSEILRNIIAERVLHLPRSR